MTDMTTGECIAFAERQLIRTVERREAIANRRAPSGSQVLCFCNGLYVHQAHNDVITAAGFERATVYQLGAKPPRVTNGVGVPATPKRFSEAKIEALANLDNVIRQYRNLIADLEDKAAA